MDKEEMVEDNNSMNNMLKYYSTDTMLKYYSLATGKDPYDK
jgi:hypothetical protein